MGSEQHNYFTREMFPLSLHQLQRAQLTHIMPVLALCHSLTLVLLPGVSSSKSSLAWNQATQARISQKKKRKKKMYPLPLLPCKSLPANCDKVPFGCRGEQRRITGQPCRNGYITFRSSVRKFASVLSVRQCSAVSPTSCGKSPSPRFITPAGKYIALELGHRKALWTV